MAKLVDALASGASGGYTLCRFESGSRHHPNKKEGRLRKRPSFLRSDSLVMTSVIEVPRQFFHVSR